ncbi:MAG: acyltransferase [Deltaproteobacteria bacterium]|nr:acyltransferase [Deltaproteobacteria bacterium]
MNDPSLSPSTRFKDFFRMHLLANHYPALHGIRVLAVVTVVQVHLTILLRGGGLLDKRGELSRYSMNISFGMDLFFILSGFLIGMILLHSFEQQKGRGILRFYARRAFRTFPPYYLVLILISLVIPMSAKQTDHLPYAFLYISNYTGATRTACVMPWNWSLCVEEHFYFAVPLLLLVLHLLRSHAARIGVLIFFWLGGTATRLIIFYAHEGSWTPAALQHELMYKSHARIDILVAGILLAYLHRYFQPQIARLLTRLTARIILWIVVLACLGILLNPSFFGGHIFLYRVLKWGTFTSVMYVPLILLLLNTEGWFQRFLSISWFRRMATLGYGIYLVHFPVGAMLFPLAHLAIDAWFIPLEVVWPSFLALLLVCSVAVSYIIHLLVEKPVLYLRDRISP